MSDNVKSLVDALKFRDAVIRVLPVDDDADRLVAEFMRRSHPPVSKASKMPRR